MNKSSIIEVDCTKKCKSISHGKLLTSAITKRAITDEALASFIRTTCANFTQVQDEQGRTTLHMSASCGRKRLLEWLVKHSTEAGVNAKDIESGFTPLYRSIFYGQVHTAVSLLAMGVNSDIGDKHDYKPLEQAILDRKFMQNNVHMTTNDVYVWGSNSNYTLGTGTQQQKKTPDVLNCFSRKTSVDQICLGKFHSVWLCSNGTNVGEVYACGQLARAGATAGTALRPTQLKLPEPCMMVALTLDSTVFLLQSGTVIQYGNNNTDHVISQSTARTPAIIKLPYTKPLMKLSKPIGVCASRFHVVLWNANAAYTWGVNFGQLGHCNKNDKCIDAPKKVSLNYQEEVKLELVAVSDAATLLTTSRGDVYLLHKHITKKIATKLINLKQACVEAKVNEHGVYSTVTVLLLNNVGQLSLWQDTTNKHSRCTFGISHETFITHATLIHEAVYFTTKLGEAYFGTFSKTYASTTPQPLKAKRDKESAKCSIPNHLDYCTIVKLKKIPNVNRAVSIVVDNEGLNFACLQIKPTCGMKSFPRLSPTCFQKHMNSLLETASGQDILHDVVFKIGTKLYPAHIFIIATGTEHLYKLYQDKKLLNDETPTIVLENVHPEVFERILQYLYTGCCDVTQTGPCSLKILKEDVLKKDNKNEDDDFEIIENPAEISAFQVYKNKSDKSKKQKNRQKTSEPSTTHIYLDPVKLVQAAAKRLQVMSLHKLLDRYYYKLGNVCLKDSASDSTVEPPTRNRDSFPELVDASVCTKDGVMISAHKCVLAARLEYFHCMFINSWTESKAQSTISLPVNHAVLLPLINFLYTDTCPEIEASDSLDFICSILIVSDQFLITRLREICEIALTNLITIKNCPDICQFAHTYNALQLKRACMEFISINLANFLENRSLDILDDSLLEDITKYYCSFNPIMSSRVITPFCDAPDDDTINEVHKLYPVDLDAVDENLKSNADAQKRKQNKVKFGKFEHDSDRTRMRNESVSSISSLDMSNDNSHEITLSLSEIKLNGKEVANHDKWIKVSTTQQKQQKVVQARLKAISIAKDILNEPQTESFVKLTKNSPVTISSPTDKNTPTTRLSVSPKESPSFEGNKSQGNITFNWAGPKMSQKQRKKLAMQGESSHTVEESFVKATSESPVLTAPRNPWKIAESPITNSSPKAAKSLEFNQILADQKKQKDNYSRIITKPLNLTQLEDKAIEELERFYNVHEIDDELISVRRIELHMSAPLWVHTVPK